MELKSKLAEKLGLEPMEGEVDKRKSFMKIIMAQTREARKKKMEAIARKAKDMKAINPMINKKLSKSVLKTLMAS